MQVEELETTSSDRSRGLQDEMSKLSSSYEALNRQHEQLRQEYEQMRDAADSGAEIAQLAEQNATQ